jgi:manganese transport protein
VRRLITRGAAIVPVVIAIGLYGERGADDLLILSQVILSIQLPFAAIPLVHFVSSRKKMGNLVLGPWLSGLAWAVTGLIVALNLLLLAQTLRGVGL